jgi:hypothetical protein
MLYFEFKLLLHKFKDNRDSNGSILDNKRYQEH